MLLRKRKLYLFVSFVLFYTGFFATAGQVVKIYVYQWPSDVVTIPTLKGEANKRFTENNHLGAVVDRQKGLFETSPYSLFKYTHSRLLNIGNFPLSDSRSIIVTSKANEADLFFIPLDITYLTWEANELSIQSKTSGATPSQQQVTRDDGYTDRAARGLALLNSSYWFNRCVYIP